MCEESLADGCEMFATWIDGAPGPTQWKSGNAQFDQLLEFEFIAARVCRQHSNTETGEYRGRYHVLLGAMSPLEGIGTVARIADPQTHSPDTERVR